MYDNVRGTEDNGTEKITTENWIASFQCDTRKYHTDNVI